jgi:outer membrane protein assembly factor BamB
MMGAPATIRSESMSRMTTRGWVVVLTILLAIPSAGFAGDWPMWRYDAQRSAAAPDELPAKLSLHWVRELPPLAPAWPDQPKMQFDAAYEPVVAGQRMFLGSSHDDSVTAYDTRSGRELWTFSANGPVRFAPLVWEARVYFASDDGCLYCLQAADGALVWKFRGGPSDRKVLGNERLISTWPARGAPVIADGKIYFAAGIWPFMGIFLHALDAKTGEVIWTNDGDGSTYMKQPHNADSFAGVAPQGALVAIGEQLLVPGGRSVPACYDRATGKLLYYQLADNAKRGGGSTVAAGGGLIFNGGSAFDLATEKQLGDIGDFVAVAGDRLYDGEGGKLRELDLPGSQRQGEKTVDRKGKAETTIKWSVRELGKAGTPQVTALIRAGSRLYVGSAGRVSAFALPLSEDGTAKPVWEIAVEGTPASLIAADDRLIAATLEGKVYCWGAADKAPAAPRAHPLPKAELAGDPAASKKVESILTNSEVDEGYCLIYEASSQLVGELLRHAPALRIVAIQPDAARANALRLMLRKSGIGGRRAAVLAADPTSAGLPPYLASLAIVESPPAAAELRPAFVASLFEALRPFGGAACLPNFSESARPDGLAGAVWKSAGDMTLLVRSGPLPDSADWTHEHADAANTRVSKDKRVKAPLGLLWFGGSTNTEILPRHGHGPQPQVVDGRLFIEGMDLIRAVDIYTGRILWEASLPGVGALYNNTAHQPGANASGTNYIATKEGVYVAYRNSCVRLDSATGKQAGVYQLPAAPGAKEPPVWGYLNVEGDFLVGGADPLFNEGLAGSRGDNDNFVFSRRLIVMDRASGKVLWTAEARNGFRHNAICIGGGRLYAIDRMSGPELSRLKRRGQTPPHGPRLIAFDLAGGSELWSTEKDVFGTWLSYSAPYDVLVEAGRQAADTINDEAKGIRTYQGANGAVRWENKSLSGYALLHHDTILMAGKACDILFGKPRVREHPLSGELVEWTWTRNYGCNTPLASEHLLTFRSGAAGYFDLCNDGGTGNFGGFRSSCTNNLIVAGGLITAADYTRTCTCSYQNQTSIALVPMPDVEQWTFTGTQLPKEAVRRLGLNLGAPGDRKAEDGTLWLEYPSVGGASPAIEVAIEPREPEWFRRHSSQVAGPGLAWVAASGAKGLTSVSVKLADKNASPRKYTLRLHFMEPDVTQPGERIFSIRVQGRPAVAAFDVVKEAGGRNRSLVKELPGIEVADKLVIELLPAGDAQMPASVLSGIEVQAEGW